MKSWVSVVRSHPFLVSGVSLLLPVTDADVVRSGSVTPRWGRGSPRRFNGGKKTRLLFLRGLYLTKLFRAMPRLLFISVLLSSFLFTIYITNITLPLSSS
jgi:hypothetical protein